MRSETILVARLLAFGDSSMSARTPKHWLEVVEIEGVTVAAILQPELFDGEGIDWLGGQLSHLVLERGCRRLVLDLSAVKRLSTDMIAEVIVVHKRIRSAGGRLVVCGLNSNLQELFQLLKLHSLFGIRNSREEALASFRPPNDDRADASRNL